MSLISRLLTPLFTFIVSPVDSSARSHDIISGKLICNSTLDAEVGNRNLADSFRYNALPGVVGALKLSPEPGTALQDLPEYMQLAALVSLSRYSESITDI